MMKRLRLLVVSSILSVFLSGTLYADTTYTIKKGDNPSRIAKKFNVSSRDLLRANNLNSRSLKPGAKITIPSAKKTARKNAISGSKHSARNTSKGKRNGGPAVHVVKKGDSLSALSKKYSISVSELKVLNRMKSTKLKPGQRLVVRKSKTETYIAKKKDGTRLISKNSGGDADELMDMNSSEADDLSTGYIFSEQGREGDDAKTYDAIISNASPDSETEAASPSRELSDMGMQERLILFAKKLLDIPYRFGGNSLLGIDCSAYVQKVYNVIGVSLPRSAREQFTEGDPVDKEELSIGDLVFFKTYASFPSHVGIYLGNSLFIHASSRSKKVTIDSLDTPYYFKRFIGAKRVIDGKYEKTESHNEG
jgi:peptidoglycan DL-endopeptidase LytE